MPNSPLLMQSVFIPRGASAEGQIVAAVTLPWFEIIRLIEKDPDVIYKIDPRKMEEIIAGAYTAAGFDDVVLTPRSGDYGRDIIATKRAFGSIRVIDQVKKYKPGHLVTADDVRALLGVLQRNGASKGFLTTTSDFAPGITSDPLLTPFMPWRIELVNGSSLVERLQVIAETARPAGCDQTEQAGDEGVSLRESREVFPPALSLVMKDEGTYMTEAAAIVRGYEQAK